jgi:hypothetical protein
MDHATLAGLVGPIGWSGDPQYVGPTSLFPTSLLYPAYTCLKYKWNLLFIKYVHDMLFFL